MPDPIRVMIVEDHPTFSYGLVKSIERRDDLEPVAAVTTATEALEALAGEPVDVVLLDITLPDGNAISRISELRAAGARHVLVLSAHTDGQSVHGALAAGADGFVPKDADRSDICDAIVSVAHGEAYLWPGLQAQVVEEIRRVAEASVTRLSEREHQILVLIAEGMSYAAIGQRLYLGTATVKTYASRAFEKLGVSDRSAAVAEAMRRGLIS
jgi:two-component system nitrate/nitrite response regulator NarL